MGMPVQRVRGGGTINPNASVSASITIDERGHRACCMIGFVAAQEIPERLHEGGLTFLVLGGVELCLGLRMLMEADLSAELADTRAGVVELVTPMGVSG